MKFLPLLEGDGPTFSTKATKKATSELFVFIPLDWMIAANKSGSAASAVAIPLWFISKTRGESLITLSNELATRFGIGRKRKALGLKQLYEAGLINIDCHCGRSPRVQLLAAPFIRRPKTQMGATACNLLQELSGS